jgi:hypothetical protein
MRAVGRSRCLVNNMTLESQQNQPFAVHFLQVVSVRNCQRPSEKGSERSWGVLNLTMEGLSLYIFIKIYKYPVQVFVRFRYHIQIEHLKKTTDHRFPPWFFAEKSTMFIPPEVSRGAKQIFSVPCCLVPERNSWLMSWCHHGHCCWFYCCWLPNDATIVVVRFKISPRIPRQKRS